MPHWLGEYDLSASALASGTTGVPSECSTYPKAQAFKSEGICMHGEVCLL